MLLPEIGLAPAPRHGSPPPRVGCPEPAGRPDAGDEPPASGVFPVTAASSDEMLARAACAGDPRAPTLISRRYAAGVRSKLRRWIGPDEIDDRTQDVFVRLFEQLPRMRDPAALRGFLASITRRIACTELRRRRRSRLHLTETGELPERALARIDDRGPACEALWRFESILDKLGPSSRRVFVLRYVEKLELTDVADRMQISVATAKRHLARAAATVSAMVMREPALADFLAQGARGTSDELKFSVR